LQQVLTAPDRAKLQALTNETPVEQSGTFIIVKQCMPHDCGNQNAMVVLDTISRRMWVGFFARTAHVNSTRWFGTSDVHDLTPDVLRIFDAQHTPQ